MRSIDQGFWVGIHCLNAEAEDWLDEHTQAESYQYLGNILWLEQAYAWPIIDGMLEDGLEAA